MSRDYNEDTVESATQDVLEALLHVAIYAGVPRANHAIKIAKETFAEMEETRP